MAQNQCINISDIFKNCSCCSHEWKTRSDFLGDPRVKIIGYQAHFEELKAGLLFFNHTCGTTLALYAEIFADLYDGPIFQDRQTGGENCPGYCLNEENLDPCPAKCECAFVRAIIQHIKQFRKQQDTVTAPNEMNC